LDLPSPHHFLFFQAPLTVGVADVAHPVEVAEEELQRDNVRRPAAAGDGDAGVEDDLVDGAEDLGGQGGMGGRIRVGLLLLLRGRGVRRGGDRHGLHGGGGP
jgi:hypothetical protein